MDYNEGDGITVNYGMKDISKTGNVFLVNAGIKTAIQNN